MNNYIGESQHYSRYRQFDRQRSVGPRINKQIRISYVRLINKNGEKLGVVSTIDAQKKAQMQGLDLVEISPKAHPPVCKIMDYGKFKYQQKRKAALVKKRQVQVGMKEVKFRPKTDIHDFNVKVSRLKKFLSKGNKGKVTMMFRGREIVHTNIGKESLFKIVEKLKGTAFVESPAKMEGRQMVMILAPEKQTVIKK